MGLWYDWRFREPGESLSAHFTDIENGTKLFDATLSLRRREIGNAALARVLINYPFMTVKVTTMIHWQALRLWLKGHRFSCTRPSASLLGRSSLMKATIIPPSAPALHKPGPTLLHNWARTQVLALFQGLRYGRLVIIDGEERWSFGGDATGYSRKQLSGYSIRVSTSGCCWAAALAPAKPTWPATGQPMISPRWCGSSF